jgi:hypothetical protein
MKTLFYPTIILFTALFSCNKDNPENKSPDTGLVGNWQLRQKSWSIGPSYAVIKPSADSSVLLILNGDSSFISELNGIVVSQGSYSIQQQPNYPSDSIFQLNNFKTTGIFSLFTLYEIGNNGQVISTYDGFTMKISHDTLRLASTITPGGNESYIFTKE